MRLKKRNFDYFADLSSKYWEEEEKMRRMMLPQNNTIESLNYSMINLINMEDYNYFEIGTDNSVNK